MAEPKEDLSLRARGFCFTWNNYTAEDVLHVQSLDCTYMVFGKEVAPTTGTPHLQGYVYYVNARTKKAVIKDFKGKAHIIIAKGDAQQNADYCGKDAEPFTKGIKPLSDKEKGLREKEKWKLVRTAAQAGNWSEIPDDIYIRYQASLKRIHREDQAVPEDLARKQHYGIWIYGPPGTGKSHLARTKYGPYYMKDLNKWWDDYSGKDTVIIDEYAPEHSKYMIPFMKKWVDRWSFSAEVKGGRVVLRPPLIIVTSNYSIEECFQGIDLEAIGRRFTRIHCALKYTHPIE